MDSYIFQLMDRQELSEVIEAFYACIGIPIQILDEQGNNVLSCGTQCSYCRKFINMRSEESCSRIHAAAGTRAMALGESYIFSCRSNLNHIIFPLLNAEKLYGSVLVGPFLMDPPESGMILNLGKRYPDMTMQQLMDLYDEAQEVPLAEPAKVTQISRLVYHLFSNLLVSSREQFIINRNKLNQQSKINDSIRRYKQLEEELPEYPIQREEDLMTKVREGNLGEARTILNELLGYVFFSGGNHLDAVKSRLVELCAMLCRAAIASGVPSRSAFAISNSFIGNLEKFTGIEDLCYGLEEVLNAYIELMFPDHSSSGSRPVREAMKFISAHFYENITLKDVASQVYLNESYFSRLFKNVTGMTFKDYLTQVRVDEAKRLLKNTDFTLADIAMSIGYENQSYFTRVFKAAVGMTPSEFRKI